VELVPLKCILLYGSEVEMGSLLSYNPISPQTPNLKILNANSLMIDFF
jgi:hypothetical protein